MNPYKKEHEWMANMKKVNAWIEQLISLRGPLRNLCVLTRDFIYGATMGISIKISFSPYRVFCHPSTANRVFSHAPDRIGLYMRCVFE